jgi:3-oxoacyl-[acyl-carrier-protein] synthase II
MMAAVDHRGRPRVVVTGIGVKAPTGQTVQDFWDGLVAGHSTAAPVTLFDASDHSVDMACEVRDFDGAAVVGPKEVRRTDRATLLGLAAAADAIEDAGGNDALGVPPERRGVVAGTGVGGIRTTEDQVMQYTERGPSRASPFLVPMMMINATAATIGIRYGWTGPNIAVATACATGGNAIGEGARMIRDGTADVVVCGGTESSVAPVSLAAFARMGALSRNDDPAAASRPFDVDRDGFVMGEGAGFVVLESYDRAEARGAEIQGEILGYGMTCDAFHITAPLETGAGAAACIRAALADAGLEPDAVGHVNAHGTSTPHNDAAEASAISDVFGEHSLPVTSIKGSVGHLIGAAGAVEAIAALRSASTGVLPPTVNHEKCDRPVDVVAGERTIDPAPAVSTSFAFGGHNVALVVGPAA